MIKQEDYCDNTPINSCEQHSFILLHPAQNSFHQISYYPKALQLNTQSKGIWPMVEKGEKAVEAHNVQSRTYKSRLL